MSSPAGVAETAATESRRGHGRSSATRCRSRGGARRESFLLSRLWSASGKTTSATMPSARSYTARSRATRSRARRGRVAPPRSPCRAALVGRLRRRQRASRRAPRRRVQRSGAWTRERPTEWRPSKTSDSNARDDGDDQDECLGPIPISTARAATTLSCLRGVGWSSIRAKRRTNSRERRQEQRLGHHERRVRGPWLECDKRCNDERRPEVTTRRARRYRRDRRRRDHDRVDYFRRLVRARAVVTSRCTGLIEERMSRLCARSSSPRKSGRPSSANPFARPE